MHNQAYSYASIAVLLAAATGCASIAGLDDLEVVNTPVEAGSGGASGTAGTAGSAGIAGSAGTAGKAGGGGTAGAAGKAGNGGTAGSAGTAGTGGIAGTAGTAGSGGCEPGTAQCKNTTEPQLCDSKGTWQDLPACTYVCLNGACGGVCSPSSKQCLGNTPQQCVETGIGWVNLSTCPAVCKNGECVGSCTPNTDKQCVGNVSMVCNAAGDGWVPNPSFPVECPNSCQNGECVGECKPNAVRCGISNPKEIQYCNKDGVWTFQQLCVTGCDAGQCVETCVEGTVRCKPGSTNALEECASGTWEYVSDCTNACVNGTCVDCYPNEVRCDPNNPDNIQMCDATSHTWAAGTWCGANLTCSGGMCVASTCTEGSKRCQDGKSSLETCLAGIWTSEPCPTGSSCSNNQCAGCTSGAQTCHTNGQTLWVCAGNVWTQQECPIACQDASCIECTTASPPQCQDSSTEQVCLAGQWQTFPCGPTETCVTGTGCSAVAVCTSGQRQCSGNSPQLCNATGQWDTAAACSGLASTCKDGFCVCSIGTGGPDMVSIGDHYCMDRTEVTRGQYQAWASSVVVDISQRAECSWNGNLLSFVNCGVANCSGSDCSLPQTCVDWCDAYAYCKAVGKRLCGRVDGGANATSDTSSTRNAWYYACSAGATADYGYGSTYSATACNGAPLNLNALAAVGSIATCHGAQPPSQSVYDLSGNASEWVDTCSGTTGASDQCHIAGGSYSLSQPNPDLKCAVVGSQNRGAGSQTVGFRCCSKTTAPHVDWVQQAGNTSSNTEMTDVVGFASSGDSVIAGTYAAAGAYFGDQPQVMLPAPSGGGARSFLARYAPTGGLQWAKACAGHDLAGARTTRALAKGPSEEVFLAGVYRQNTDCGDAAHQLPDLGGSGALFVAKFDLGGDLQQLVYSTGNNTESANDVSYDSNGGGFVLGGDFSGAMKLSSGVGTITSYGDLDGVIALHDAAGSLSWIRQSGGSGADSCSAVAAVPNGIVAAYRFESMQLTLDPESPTSVIVDRAGQQDTVVLGRTLSGSLAWFSPVQGTGPLDRVTPTDLVALPSGAVLLLGVYSGVAKFGAPGFIQLPSATGTADGFLAMYDVLGNVLWARRLGRQSGASVGSTLRGSAGDDASFYLAASTSASSSQTVMLGEGESNETVLKSKNPSSPVVKDAVFAHYNWDGTLDWASLYGDTSDDQGANLAVLDPARAVGGMTFHSSSVEIAVGGTTQQFNLANGTLLLLHYSK